MCGFIDFWRKKMIFTELSFIFKSINPHIYSIKRQYMFHFMFWIKKRLQCLRFNIHWQQMSRVTFLRTGNSIRNVLNRGFGELFCPVSQRVQMNLIFPDNVHILCLSCNIKKPKTTAKLSKESRNKHRSCCVFCEIRAYTVTVSYRRSTWSTRNCLSWSVTVYNKHLSSQCNLIAQIEPMQAKSLLS